MGHICPEAWDGGPLAYVQDGDLIEINVRKRWIQPLVADEQLRRRQENPVARPAHPAPGMLAT